VRLKTLDSELLKFGFLVDSTSSSIYLDVRLKTLDSELLRRADVENYTLCD
jgi:hypothetical protein